MMLIDPLGKVVHVYAWWYCQIVPEGGRELRLPGYIQPRRVCELPDNYNCWSFLEGDRTRAGNLLDGYKLSH